MKLEITYDELMTDFNNNIKNKKLFEPVYREPVFMDKTECIKFINEDDIRSWLETGEVKKIENLIKNSYPDTIVRIENCLKQFLPKLLETLVSDDKLNGYLYDIYESLFDFGYQRETDYSLIRLSLSERCIHLNHQTIGSGTDIILLPVRDGKSILPKFNKLVLDIKEEDFRDSPETRQWLLNKI